MKPDGRPQVVVSGVSGRFPQSDNMEEFERNLYNGTDMVTADDARWPLGIWNLTHRNGKIKSFDRFDNDFFELSENVVNYSDPQERLFLELTFEALVDAGHDPSRLKGTKTGFFWGSCFLETHGDFDDPMRIPPVERSMISRVSQFFEFSGPLIHTDTACNSSLCAFTEAMTSLRLGLCDRALVAGSNTCFRPLVSLRFRDLKMINKDGTCKCLDESANGYCRSEAVVVIVLERQQEAKRIYAKVLHAKNNSDGFKDEGITFPSVVGQRRLATETYKEAGINPADIGYIEAHVTGTAAGDPVEMEAMYDVICTKREQPLIVGCVKSLIGHSEGASGLCSVAKALIVLQNRQIPPNIYYRRPNPNVKGLMNGKMIAPTKVTPLPGSIIPVNSFGFGGANTHVVLQGHYPEDQREELSELPRLVTICGRTLDSVRYIQKKLSCETKLITNGFLSLLDDFAAISNRKFKYRGYAIVRRCPRTGVLQVEKQEPRLVTDFAKTGSSQKLFLQLSNDQHEQIKGNSNELLGLDAFKAKLDKFSKESGHDLLALFDRGCSKPAECEMVQVATDLAFIDMFKDCGIKFDGLCGDQVNSLVMAFHAGNLTAGQAIKSAQSANQVTLKSQAPSDAYVVKPEGLQTVGDLYCRGWSVHSSKLYRSVQYPLPSWTPTLSSLLKWNHSMHWSLKPYLVQDNFFQKSKNLRFFCDSRTMDDVFLFDHKIDGRTLYPATGYLMLVWMAFAKFLSCAVWDYAIEFRNVEFKRATVVSKGSETVFFIRVNEDNGDFAVVESDSVVVTGNIRKRDTHAVDHPEPEPDPEDQLVTELPARALYKEFRVRGYDYGQYFQGINSAASNGRRAQIIWRDVLPKTVSDALTLETDEELANLWLRSWVPFVDALFQLDILKSENDSRSLFVPTRIDSIICSPELLRKNIEKSPKFTDALTMSEASLLSCHGRVDNLIWTEGLIVKGLKCTMLKRKQQAVRVQKYELMPFTEQNTLNPRDRKLVENYASACQAAAKGRDVPHSFKLDDPRFALLKSLSTSESCDLTSDLLAGQCEDEFYYPERLIVPVINTVINNMAFSAEGLTPVDILEVTGSSWSLVHRMKDILDTILVDDIIKVNYQLLAARPQYLPPAIVEAAQQVHEWTFNSYGVPVSSQDLIIYRSSPVDPSDTTERLAAILKPSAFLYTIIKSDSTIIDANNNEGSDQVDLVDQAIKNAQAAGLTLIGQRKPSQVLPLTTLLFRKASPPLPRDCHTVLRIGHSNFEEWFEQLQRLLAEEDNKASKRVWLVPRRSQSEDFRPNVTGIVGLIKSLRLEEGGDRLRSLVDLSSTIDIDIFDPKYEQVLRNDLIHNIWDEKSQCWGSYEHQYLPDTFQESDRAMQTSTEKTSQPVYLKVLKPGDMSSLTWTNSDIPQRQTAMVKSGKSHRVIDVHYSALNFRDIMFASGKLDSEAIPGIHPDVAQDSILGLEYAGVDSKTGQRVMGITPFKGLATHVLASEDDEDFIWPVPESWSLEEAATVPVVYATAMYALVIRGRMQPGESVLIHSGCGGVGLAAINLCLARGCEVYTTVGSDQKRKYLLDRWPSLKGHIFNSRSIDFEADILRATDGNGVDLILNSLAEDKLQASLRCLAPGGRFLEIGKVDFIQNHALFSHQLSSNQSFHGVLLDALFRYNSTTYLPPRMLAEKKQLRQLLIEGFKDGSIRPLDRTCFNQSQTEDAFRYMMGGRHIGKVLVGMQDQQVMAAMPATYCHPDKSYIVLGGSGGFGLEVVQWLAQKGARTLVISSRTGLKEPYQHYAINRLRAKGIQVLVDTSDITTEEGCRAMIDNAQKLGGPLGGFFNAAVVYRDALYRDQPIEQFVAVCGPKSVASLHFDKLTRQSCPQLDYFVTWSSLSCARGNIGQTNYSFANSLMDSICEKRRADGLPGVSIQWGVVGDAGIVADINNSNDMILLGSQAQRMYSCLEVLDRSVQGSDPVVISYVKADPRSDGDGGADQVDILNVITRLLGLKDMSNMDPELTLGGLGVDSLIAVEIKQALDRTLGTQMSVREVRDLTIADLMKISADQYQAGDKAEGS